MVIFSFLGMSFAESVSPDRPTVSMSAKVLNPASGLFEFGVFGAGELTSPTLGMNALLRYGIGDGFEIRVDTAVDQHGDGLNLSPGVKWTAPKAMESLDLGVALHPVLPIGQDFAVKAAALANLGIESLSISVNAGGLIVMAGPTSFTPQGSLVLGYALGGFSPFLEVSGSIEDEIHPAFGGGMIWSNAQLALDFAAFYSPAHGVDSSPAYQGTIGCTYRFKGE